MVLDPLAQINAITVAGTIVVFFVTLLLLRRILFLPLIEVMEQRAAKLEQAKARKAEADALLERAQLEVQQTRSIAAAEAAQLIEKVRDETARIRSERLAGAGAEADAILARGREEIRVLRHSEDARLADELCTCVTAMLTTMIGPVDAAAVRLTVMQVVAGREAG
jgi:F-type H+-transporting ATPase subunit b